MKKEILKSVLLYTLLLLIGVIFLLLTGRGTGVFLQNDSIHYLNIDLCQGVMPIYPLFIHIIKILVGENNLQYSVVIVQTFLAVFCTLDLLFFLRKHFNLCLFDTCVGYVALMLLWGIDYAYAWVPHQILTEGLAFPLFYVWFKYILKMIWTDKNRYIVLSWIWSIVLGLIRPQLILILAITVLLFYYIFFMKRQRKGFQGILIGIIIGIVLGIGGKYLIATIDLTYQRFAVNHILADESNENTNAKREVKQSSNATQANSALSLRVLYLADEEDAVRRQITIGCNSKLNFRLTSIRPRGLTGNCTFLSD